MTDAECAECRRVNPGPIRPLHARELEPGSNAWETMTRRQRRLYHQRKAPTRPSSDSLHAGDGRPHDFGPPGGGPRNSLRSGDGRLPVLASSGEEPSDSLHVGVMSSRTIVPPEGGMPLCCKTVLDLSHGRQAHVVHPIGTSVAITSDGDIVTTPIVDFVHESGGPDSVMTTLQHEAATRRQDDGRSSRAPPQPGACL